MPDASKIAKGLQEIVDDKWMRNHADWYVSICADTLILLKEQEEQIRKLAEENDDLKKARNEVYYSGYDGSFIL